MSELKPCQFGGVMDCEQFLADIGKTHVEVEHMGGTLSRVKSVFNVVPVLVRNNERLERENAELMDELDDWKGSAEGFQPDAYMKLPLDADGVPIRIGDVLYSCGNECRVVSITVKADEACVGVHTDEGVFLPSVNPKYLSRKNTEPLEPEPADSWMQLSTDTKMGAVMYADKILGVDIRGTTTEEDYDAFARDIVRRAKALVKAGEGE